MATFRLTIEYDGSPFSGWQVQPNGRTVQGELERGLAIMLRKQVRIQGAGRTDAGVHALGQVASFVTDTDLPPRRFQKGLCALCRPHVSVVDAAIAPDGFNARYDSNGKHYRYQLLARKSTSPLHRKTSYFVPYELDLRQMKLAADLLVGEHDFKGFRAADCERKSTVSLLKEVRITRGSGGLVFIDIEGIAFLKYMVRVISGTLVEIGRGRLEPKVIEEIFTTRDRARAGPTAPPHGLTLVEVFYPKGWLRKKHETDRVAIK
jgi:tRNA pseudouridine38-40 synthase